MVMPCKEFRIVVAAFLEKHPSSDSLDHDADVLVTGSSRTPATCAAGSSPSKTSAPSRFMVGMTHV